MRDTGAVFVDPRGDEARRFRILFVDDEEDIRRTIGRYIESALPQVSVVTAATGAEALAILRERPVDIILSDYKMPGMNGIEFLTQARAIAPAAPTIMITAYPDLDLALKAVNEQRVQRFLTKPVDPASLLEVLKEILASIRSAELRDEAFKRIMESLKG